MDNVSFESWVGARWEFREPYTANGYAGQVVHWANVLKLHLEFQYAQVGRDNSPCWIAKPILAGEHLPPKYMGYASSKRKAKEEACRKMAYSGHCVEPWESASDDMANVVFTNEELALLDGNTSEDVEKPVFGPRTLEETFCDIAKRIMGFSPRDWQLRVGTGIFEGFDVLALAGTGAGKTLTFILVALLLLDMIVWVVSPLNYIEMEQAKVFEGWGLRSIAVNSVTSYPNLLKDIINGQYRVIISSIESMLAPNKLRPALGSLKLMKRRHLLVVDEAHCISSWAESGFRPQYAHIGKLRRLLPPNTPVLAVTATANKAVQKNIMHVLNFRDKHQVVNVGNHRSNLIQCVHRLQRSGEAAVDELRQFFPSRHNLPLALIFVDSRAIGQAVYDSMQRYVAPECRGQVQLYHAFRSELSKRVIEEGFRQEIFRVIICTESLTMGADFRRVILVINFLAPDSLRTWEQRGGRGARDQATKCWCILAVQPSLYKDSKDFAPETETTGEGAEGEIEAEIETEQPVEEIDGEQGSQEDRDATPRPAAALGTRTGAAKSLRRTGQTHTKALIGYINETGCRIAYLDKEYDNPHRPDDPPCRSCDNCLKAAGDPDNLLPAIAAPATVTPNATKSITWLRPAERATCEEALRRWRREKWSSPECADMDIMESYILPDKYLVAIARHPAINSVADLEDTPLVWPHRTLWGHEVVSIIRAIQDTRKENEARRRHIPVLKQAARSGEERLRRIKKAHEEKIRKDKADLVKQEQLQRANKRQEAAKAREAQKTLEKERKKVEREKIK